MPAPKDPKRREEWLEKLRQARLGNSISTEARKKITNSNLARWADLNYRARVIPNMSIANAKRTLPPWSEKRKKEASERMKGRDVYWLKGVPKSSAHKAKISKSNREFYGVVEQEPYPNYNVKYTNWREQVLNRDGRLCQDCGSGEGTFPHTLNAHHIKWQAHCPQDAFELWNGVTLCFSCHQNRHKLEKRYGKISDPLDGSLLFKLLQLTSNCLVQNGTQALPFNCVIIE